MSDNFSIECLVLHECAGQVSHFTLNGEPICGDAGDLTGFRTSDCGPDALTQVTCSHCRCIAYNARSRGKAPRSPLPKDSELSAINARTLGLELLESFGYRAFWLILMVGLGCYLLGAPATGLGILIAAGVVRMAWRLVYGFMRIMISH